MKKFKVPIEWLRHAAQVFHLPGLSKFENADWDVCDLNSELMRKAAEKAGVVNMFRVNRRFNPLMECCRKKVLDQNPILSVNGSFYKGIGALRKFTIVELLVVIAIITLLFSLLMPALGKAKNAATAISCGNGLHQISIRTVSYLSDSNGSFPYFALRHGQIRNGFKPSLRM